MTDIRKRSSELRFGDISSCVIFLLAAALWLTCEKTPESEGGRVVKYEVVVSSEGAGAMGGGEYPPAATVIVTAGTPPPGYQFIRWESSVAGVTFAPSANNVTVAFNMPASAVTVTAVFEEIPADAKYSVTVSSAGTGATGGGKYPPDTTVIVTAGTPPPGYQFIRWESSYAEATFAPSANNAIATFNMPASAVTVTAVFEEISATARTITFNCGGGTVSPASGYTDADGRLVSLPTPIRTGYRFDGWFTAETGGEQVTAGVADEEFATGTIFSSDAAIYARWTIETYTITYTLNGGTATNPLSYTVETADFTLNNPTKKDYIFAGWTGSNGTTPQTSVSIKNGSSGGKSYTANWTAIVHTITYYLDSGTVSPANPTSYTIETATFTLNNPTKTGYIFAGWTGSNGTIPQTSVSVANGSTGSKNYNANWTVITYTITYTLNGGTVSSANPTSYTIETENFKLNNPTKTGYIFAGWTGSNDTTPQIPVSIKHGSTGDKSYTANWMCTLTVEGNPTSGGSVTPNNPSNHLEGTLVSISATANSGYIFENWTIASGNGVIFDADSASARVSVNGNVTVKANFTHNGKLTVERNPTFGGSVTPNSQSNLLDGALVNISAAASPGYTFKNWTITSGSCVIFDADSASTRVSVNGSVTVRANFTQTGKISGDPLTYKGQTYQTVVIDGKTWMAKNLNYQPTSGNSWCYLNSADSCNKYGRLYDWETANTVCPPGWRLPDTADWRILATAAGGAEFAGKMLKSASGWYRNGNGTDDFGFSALPGGYRFSADDFRNAGNYGYWWTATKHDVNDAYSEDMGYSYFIVNELNELKSYGRSVRCIED